MSFFESRSDLWELLKQRSTQKQLPHLSANQTHITLLELKMCLYLLKKMGYPIFWKMIVSLYFFIFITSAKKIKFSHSTRRNFLESDLFIQGYMLSNIQTMKNYQWFGCFLHNGGSKDSVVMQMTQLLACHGFWRWRQRGLRKRYVWKVKLIKDSVVVHSLIFFFK
jgi:hypothetical protein